MENFVLTDEIELADEQLGAVFGATGTFNSYDYNQTANNLQGNTATVSQLAAASAIGGSNFLGNSSGNAAASATNLSNINQANSNTQKQWYYWY